MVNEITFKQLDRAFESVAVFRQRSIAAPFHDENGICCCCAMFVQDVLQ